MAAKYTNQPPCPAATNARNRQATSAVPAASPFSPSMKFIALVTNSSHASVAATPSQPRSTGPTYGTLNVRTYSPLPTAAAAATSCAASFTVNGQSRRSSRNATTAISERGQDHAAEIRVGEAGEVGVAIQHRDAEHERHHDRRRRRPSASAAYGPCAHPAYPSRAPTSWRRPPSPTPARGAPQKARWRRKAARVIAPA